MSLKSLYLLPVCLVLVFALSRWPGLMPQNFSAVYALVFCSGVFFASRLAWCIPLATLLLTDLVLNAYYQAQGWEVFTAKNTAYLAGNYLSYAILIILGRLFCRIAWKDPQHHSGFWSRLASWTTLIGGGLIGAVLFYLITNTLAWFFNPFANPEYTKTLSGWLQALTGGTAGWPQTWQFFKSTLGSSGLFTGLFAGAMHLAEAMEPSTECDQNEAEESAESDDTNDPEPEKSPA